MSKITNFSNMYNDKSNNNLDDAKLKQILASLSVGDTKHDFHYDMGILKSTAFKKAFNYGLPDGGGYDDENIMKDEEACLASIVKTYRVNNQDRSDSYNPINASNPQYTPGVTNKHNITTINNKEFTVTYTDVKPRKKSFGMKSADEEITSNLFFKNLLLDDLDNIAIVVDAASIRFFEILTNGNKMNKNVYYIYGPEVINDPATKKQPSDKIFSNIVNANNNGVKLISCVPLQKNSASKFNYSFAPNVKSLISTQYLNQFYTKYNFVLSDSKEISKGKSVEYVTNLDIKGIGSQINKLPDSKSKNDITFIESIMNNFKNLFVSKSSSGLTPDKQFLISSSLQQKRSGDWLQVLLCAALKDKLREFKTFNGPEKNVMQDVQEVFFVTHDRIALAFALLNGVSCIFTHHHGQTHFHSAFVFRLNDPIKQLQQDKEIATKYASSESITELKTKINTLKNEFIVYLDTGSYTKTKEKEDKLQELINKAILRIQSQLNDIPQKNAKYNIATFVDDTTTIFSTALELILSKTIFPNLQNQITELQNIYEQIDTLLSLGNQSDSEAFTSIIKNYKHIISIVENVEAIYAKIKSTTLDDYNNKLLALTKQPVYKAANDWKWDINVSSRDVIMLSDITSVKNYKLDRNIFLYNLNELDDDIKLKIAWIYYQTYNLLYNLFLEKITPTNINEYLINNNQIITDRNIVKFKAVSLAFCVEVLLTIGGGNNIKNIGGKDITHYNIIQILDKFITLNNKKIQNVLITDGIIVKEDLHIIKSKKLNQRGGDISNYQEENAFTQGSDLFFEGNNKNVTYALMTLICFSANYYSTLYFHMGNVLSDVMELYDQTPIEMTTTSSETKFPNAGIVNTKKRMREEESIDDVNKYIRVDGMVGGDIYMKSNNLSTSSYNTVQNDIRELYNSLPKMVNEDNVTTSDDNSDIFKNTSICFHPLLPIYMLTQAYLSSIINEHITESLDSDLFINYFTLLKQLKDNIVNIYSDKNNNNQKKLEAYIVGICLKQLLFVANNRNEQYQTCLELLNVDNYTYSNISSYTETLTHAVSGKIAFDDVILEQGPIYLKSKLFKTFINSINIQTIFDADIDYNSFNEDFFKQNVMQFSMEIAEKIMEDRGIDNSEQDMPPENNENVTGGRKSKTRKYKHNYKRHYTKKQNNRQRKNKTIKKNKKYIKKYKKSVKR